MTPRSLRRAAERKAKKLIQKAQQQPGAHISQEIINQAIGMSQEEVQFLRECDQEFAARAGAAIAQRESVAAGSAAAPTQPAPRCTGPITAEGKAISSLNRLKHGLTGTFRVLESESPTQFHELCDALRTEHAPATPTETLLVDRMAQHVWLSNRAQRLQDDALVECDEKSFALYLRYQTTNDRGFHRCLKEFRTLRTERHQFESQNASQAVQALSANVAEAKNHAQSRLQEQPNTTADSSNRKNSIEADSIALTAGGNPSGFTQFESQKPAQVA